MSVVQKKIIAQVLVGLLRYAHFVSPNKINLPRMEPARQYIF
jgi:hypothetical protein